MPNAKEVLEYMEWKENRVQTNEEWFCGLSTEDKAEAITDMIEECVEWNYGIRMNEVRNKIQRDYVVRWLKEKHNGAE